jgi:glyoxylase-like metal-dependent hydrolase (beta-lactamase superfamily II)
MNSRRYVLPHIIELNLQAGRSFGVNIYLIDGGSEFALLDIGLNDTFEELLDLIRKLDFPISKCKYLIASHADADHVQALAQARERLKAKTCAHAQAATLLEAGDTEQTFASIAALKFHIPMPACKIDQRLQEGDELVVGNVSLKVWHTPGHTPGQLAFKMGNVLFSGDNIYKDGSVGVIDVHHGSHLPSFIQSLKRIQADDSQFLLPSHGPVFRKENGILQNAITRLENYQYLADFGPLTVDWPLMTEWERDLLSGKLPEL